MAFQNSASTESVSSNSESFSDQARDAANRIASSAAERGSDAAHRLVTEPAHDLLSLAKAYAKDHPDVAACWTFAFGVIVGWKLRR